MTRQEMQIVVGIITISVAVAVTRIRPAAAENHGWDVLAEAIVPDDNKEFETIRSFRRRDAV